MSTHRSTYAAHAEVILSPRTTRLVGPLMADDTHRLVANNIPRLDQTYVTLRADDQITAAWAVTATDAWTFANDPLTGIVAFRVVGYQLAGGIDAWPRVTAMGHVYVDGEHVGTLGDRPTLTALIGEHGARVALDLVYVLRESGHLLSGVPESFPALAFEHGQRVTFGEGLTGTIVSVPLAASCLSDYVVLRDGVEDAWLRTVVLSDRDMMAVVG